MGMDAPSSVIEQKKPGRYARREQVAHTFPATSFAQQHKPADAGPPAAGHRPGSCPTGGDTSMPNTFPRAARSRRAALAALLSASAALAGATLAGPALAADAWPN